MCKAFTRFKPDINKRSAISDEKMAGIKKTEIRILFMNLVLASSSYEY